METQSNEQREGVEYGRGEHPNSRSNLRTGKGFRKGHTYYPPRRATVIRGRLAELAKQQAELAEQQKKLTEELARLTRAKTRMTIAAGR